MNTKKQSSWYISSDSAKTWLHDEETQKAPMQMLKHLDGHVLEHPPHPALCNLLSLLLLPAVTSCCQKTVSKYYFLFLFLINFPLLICYMLSWSFKNYV